MPPKKSNLPRKLALATTATLALAAVVIWLQPEKEAPVVLSATPQTSAGRPFVITPEVPGADAAPDNLTAIPETMRGTGTSSNLIDRLMQRQGMSRLFTGADDIELARSKSAVMVPAPRAEAISRLPFLSDRQRTDKRTFIRYDMRTLESRVEGDQVDLLLPGLRTPVKAEIDMVESVGGMLRWSGRIVGTQDGGTFSITHASEDGYAVGSIDTPSLGNFSLQAKNGWGYVADQGADFYLPPGGDDAPRRPAPNPSAR